MLAWVLLSACSAPSEPAPSLFTEEATPSPAPVADGPLRFDDVSEEWGLAARHHAGRSPRRWLPEVMGGGVALLDANRDGALDVLVADSGSLTGAAPEGAGPQLFLGDGRGGFTNRTTAWGLTPHGYGMGVATGDIDGDGWTDVYLTTWAGRDRLLRNDGGQRFVDVTEAWGVAPSGWSTSAAFLDIEGDGDLDLYVVRYIEYELEEALDCWFRTIPIYCTPSMYSATPDRLLRNDGGRFVDVSVESGIAGAAAKGLAVGTGDLDGDGDVDIYVADDITRNLLWINQGDGTFADRGTVSGVAYSELGREEASMGVAVADANADGLWDLAVTNFQAEPTSLYVARPGSSYREQADRAGIGASSRARLSFGIEFLDADNDGDDDLITANGHISDNVATYRETVQFAQLNSLYLNDGAGRFQDVSEGAGSAMARRGVSRGLAAGDLDSDGGLDVVIVENDDVLLVGANRGPRGRWLSLWLEGSPSNRPAIGATVTARIGDKVVRREVRGATSYLSASDRRVHLGLGEAGTIDELIVRWPDGSEQRIQGVDGDRHLRWVQGGEPVEYTPGAAVIPP